MTQACVVGTATTATVRNLPDFHRHPSAQADRDVVVSSAYVGVGLWSSWPYIILLLYAVWLALLVVCALTQEQQPAAAGAPFLS